MLEQPGPRDGAKEQPVLCPPWRLLCVGRGCLPCREGWLRWAGWSSSRLCRHCRPQPRPLLEMGPVKDHGWAPSPAPPGPGALVTELCLTSGGAGAGAGFGECGQNRCPCPLKLQGAAPQLCNQLWTSHGKGLLHSPAMEQSPASGPEPSRRKACDPLKLQCHRTQQAQGRTQSHGKEPRQPGTRACASH